MNCLFIIVGGGELPHFLNWYKKIQFDKFDVVSDMQFAQQ